MVIDEEDSSTDAVPEHLPLAPAATRLGEPPLKLRSQRVRLGEIATTSLGSALPMGIEAVYRHLLLPGTALWSHSTVAYSLLAFTVATSIQAAREIKQPALQMVLIYAIAIEVIVATATSSSALGANEAGANHLLVIATVVSVLSGGYAWFPRGVRVSA